MDFHQFPVDVQVVIKISITSPPSYLLIPFQTCQLINICLITITISSQTCQLIFHSFSLTTAAYTLKFVKDAMKIGGDAKAAQFDFKVIHQHYFWSFVTYTTSVLMLQFVVSSLATVDIYHNQGRLR